MKNLVQIGESNGRVTVIANVGHYFPERSVMWLCRCNCGAETRQATSHFRSGMACRDCGIKRRAASRAVHGEARKTRLYRVWANMRRRCESPTADNYRWYGGKGVKVCAEWQEYAPFRAWAMAHGYSDKLTIDRINVDGDYSPDNCRFVTIQQNIIHRDEHRRSA